MRDVPNFGANLQAFSTICYLRNAGHDPIVIKWEPDDFKKEYLNNKMKDQYKAHAEFSIKYLPQTEPCKNEGEICEAILKHNIEAMIIGSDAVLQDFPFFSRFHFPSRTIFRYDKITSERLFPNCFWGSFYVNLSRKIPMALMSASSQGTEYRLIVGKKRSKMGIALKQFKYISVRDEWTKQMVSYLTKDTIIPDVTPDPVFGFNHNSSNYILSKTEILKKFNLPESTYY